MDKAVVDIQKIRVASPCHVEWESMSGDLRKRLCAQCGIDVYNINGMTSNEVRELIHNQDGRLCIRLLRRADGTVITKDCPTGVRALRKRTVVYAGAVLSALLGLFSVSFGQKQGAVDSENVKISRTVGQNAQGDLKGVILDPVGAVIPGITISIFREGSKKVHAEAKSDDVGNFIFSRLESGLYKIRIKANYGFKKLEIKNLQLDTKKNTELKIILNVSGESVTVGIYAEDPLVDTTKSSVTKTIPRKVIETIPR